MTATVAGVAAAVGVVIVAAAAEHLLRGLLALRRRVLRWPPYLLWWLGWPRLLWILWWPGPGLLRALLGLWLLRPLRLL